MLTIRRMTDADIPLGLRLKQQARWNQTEADWRRMLDLSLDGGFVAHFDGTPVGTCVTCCFGPVAWIAMVLVDAAHRRRGIGAALLGHALDFLDRRSIRTIRLDATPLGQPLYEKLGFVADFSLTRFAGERLSRPPNDSLAEQASAQWLPQIAAIDHRVVGVDRRALLDRLCAENPRTFLFAHRRQSVTGFAAARPGSAAAFLGPCIAEPDAGESLLDATRSLLAAEKVFIDIPIPNRRATAWAHARGLLEHRPLLRMHRGEPCLEDLDRLWASSGPELG